MTIYVGIDNGVSGSIGWINNDDGTFGFHLTPTFQSIDYPKKGKNIRRIDTQALHVLLHNICLEIVPQQRSLILLERPMVNPKRFHATKSALRSLEATLITLEELELAYRYIDSKEWQKQLLPNVKTAARLKEASMQIGCQLYPSLRGKFKDDADGMLIAEWANRNKF